MATAPFRRTDPKSNSGKPRIYTLGPPLVAKKTDLISVTSILSALPKPALKAWGERLVAETAVDQHDAWVTMERDEAVDWLKSAPFRQMTRRGRRGSDIHEIAEAVLTGRIEPGDGMSAHVARFADEWIGELVTVEQTCVHLEHGWAGTTDLIFVNKQGDVVLADWKSSKGVYPDNALQLAAYARADRWLMNIDSAEPSWATPITIDRLAILHIDDAGVHYHEPDTDIATLYRQFRAVQEVWLALRGEDKIRLTVMHEPPRPTIEDYIKHLLARCLHAQAENPTFKARLHAAWPTGLPRLSSGEIVRMHQCEKADRAISRVEGDLGITFGAAPHLRKVAR